MFLAFKIGKNDDHDPACTKTGKLRKYNGVGDQQAKETDLFLCKNTGKYQRGGDKTDYHPDVQIYSAFNGLSLDYSQCVDRCKLILKSL